MGFLGRQILTFWVGGQHDLPNQGVNIWWTRNKTPLSCLRNLLCISLIILSFYFFWEGGGVPLRGIDQQDKGRGRNDTAPITHPHNSALLLTVSPVMMGEGGAWQEWWGLSITAKALSARLKHFFYPSNFEFVNTPLPFLCSHCVPHLSLFLHLQTSTPGCYWGDHSALINPGCLVRTQGREEWTAANNSDSRY